MKKIMDNEKLKMENEQLPKGWVVKKLVDVCIVERGSSPRPIKKYLTDDEKGVNWIKIGDTKNIEKYIYKTNQKITKEGAKKSRFVEEGDFILSNSMSYGKPYIVKTKGYIHDGWFKLKLHDFVDTEYFYQLLSSPLVNDQFKNLASGSVVKNISGDLVKKVVLPIPPLKEQKQIVAILDKAFTAIDQAKANAQQNLLNAAALFESYLQNVFENKGDDWVEKTLGEVCNNIFAGGDKPKNFSKFKTNKFKIPIFSNGEKNKGLYGFTDLAKVTISSITISARGTIGYSEIRKEPFTPIVRLVVLNPKKEIEIEFLKFVVSNMTFLNTGSSIPQLTVPMVKSYSFPFPKSIKEQQKIVKKLNSLSAERKKLEIIYQQKIDDLEELKKSVLQKAFNGKLKIKN